MIIYSESKYRPYLKTMWNLCFPDTDEFVALYFSKIYKDNETLLLLEEGMPVASLQMTPYQMKLGTKVLNAVYISGAMTHPLFRRRGHMEKLISHAFEENKSKGIDISFLIPQEDWLFDFYAQLGFKKAFSRSLSAHTVGKERVKSGMRSFPLSNSMMDVSYLYRSLLSVHPNVVLKTESQVNLIIEDLLLEGGQVFLNMDGIAFTRIKEGIVIIKELLSRGEESTRSLLYAIADYYQKDEIYQYQYIHRPDARDYGMIKVLNESIDLPSDIYMSMMLD